MGFTESKAFPESILEVWQVGLQVNEWKKERGLGAHSRRFTGIGVEKAES